MTMKPTIDVQVAKADYQRACTKIILAKSEAAEARGGLIVASAQYEQCKEQHSENDAEVDFALEDVRLAKESLEVALKRLDAAQRLQTVRANTLRQAKQAHAKQLVSSSLENATADPLSKLLMNPWNYPRKHALAGIQRREQSAMHYNRYKERGRTRLARCFVTEVWGGVTTVAGASLLPVATTPDNIQSKLQMTGRLEDMRNTVPLLKTIERAYDKQRLCFVLANDDDLLYKIRVLDPTVKQELVHWSMTFEDLAQKSFDLPIGKDGKRPFARCLSFHAQASYARAVRMGWVAEWEACPEAYGSPLGTDVISFSESDSDSDSYVSDME